MSASPSCGVGTCSAAFATSLEAVGQSLQRVGNRVGGRCQQFAQDQRHELTLACRQSVKRVLLQVVGNEIVEPLFVRARNEFLHQGVAVGVLDVFEHLLAQRPFADRLEPLLESAKSASPVSRAN